MLVYLAATCLLLFSGCGDDDNNKLVVPDSGTQTDVDVDMDSDTDSDTDTGPDDDTDTETHTNTCIYDCVSAEHDLGICVISGGVIHYDMQCPLDGYYCCEWYPNACDFDCIPPYEEEVCVPPAGVIHNEMICGVYDGTFEDLCCEWFPPDMDGGLDGGGY